MQKPFDSCCEPSACGTSNTCEDSIVAQLIEEFLEKVERGVPVDQEAWLAQYPELSGVLREHLRGLEMLRAFATEAHELPSADANVAQPYPVFGDYEIVREIGRGGMGVVYEAKQNSLGRRVALKVLPFASMLDRKQVTRFSIEAQAAAQLHHPNIVPVFAVGCERGIHYYSMQLIEGQPLDHVIDELKALDPPNALQSRPKRLFGSTSSGFCTNQTVRNREFLRGVARLGVQAAEGLQHAHEFGIIHRDIKPSNLLIDRQGDLWITDFGLARCQKDLDVTLTGAVIGTVRYMSPEQAAGRGDHVDHRSDIYSLGVTLYELATLHRVFDAESREQYLRMLEHDDPMPPRRLNPAIPADLENVLLKALSKYHSRRYQSASELAEDLRRFLSGRPTLAKRPTLADRASRWIGRHRVLVSVATLVLAFVAILSSVASILIARQAAKTELALQQAQGSLYKAHSAVNHFGMLAAERLADIPQAEPIRRELLLDAIRFYEEFIEEVGSQPKLQTDLALAHGKRAELLEQLGQFANAIADYEAAIRMLEPFATHELDHRSKLDRASARDHLLALARCKNNLAMLYAQEGNLAKATHLLENALTLGQKLADGRDRDVDAECDLARTYGNLGQILWESGDVAAASSHLRLSADLLNQLVTRFPDRQDLRRDLALRCNNNCFLLIESVPDEAAMWSADAISALQPLVNSDGEAACEADLAVCWNNRAAVLRVKNRLVESSEAYEKVVAAYQRLCRHWPGVVAFRAELAAAHNNSGRVAHESGRIGDARRSIQTACDQLRELVAEYPDNLAYQNTLGGALCNLATILDHRGQQNALDLYREAIAFQQRALEKSPQSASVRDMLSRSYGSLHRALVAANLNHEADRVARLQQILLDQSR